MNSIHPAYLGSTAGYSINTVRRIEIESSKKKKKVEEEKKINQNVIKRVIIIASGDPKVVNNWFGYTTSYESARDSERDGYLYAEGRHLHSGRSFVFRVHLRIPPLDAGLLLLSFCVTLSQEEVASVYAVRGNSTEKRTQRAWCLESVGEM